VDGIVVARKELQAQPVDPSMKDLLQIATDFTAWQTTLTPDAAVLPRIHTGQTAAIRAPELSPDPMTGTVREIRGTDVIVDFTSPAPIAKLGLMAQVIIKF